MTHTEDLSITRKTEVFKTHDYSVKEQQVATMFAKQAISLLHNGNDQSGHQYQMIAALLRHYDKEEAILQLFESSYTQDFNFHCGILYLLGDVGGNKTASRLTEYFRVVNKEKNTLSNEQMHLNTTIKESLKRISARDRKINRIGFKLAS